MPAQHLHNKKNWGINVKKLPWLEVGDLRFLTVMNAHSSDLYELSIVSNLLICMLLD